MIYNWQRKMALSINNKIKFAIVGALLVPCIARLAIHGAGYEYIHYRYLLLCFFGGLTGFLVGLMIDGRVRLRSKSKERKQQLSGQKIEHSQNTNAESTLYFGNNKSHTFHRPECHRAKKLRNRVIFTSRQRAVNLEYIPCRLCKP